jgi:hypothetical protein
MKLQTATGALYSTTRRQTRVRSQDPGQAHACSSNRILCRAWSREAR